MKYMGHHLVKKWYAEDKVLNGTYKSLSVAAFHGEGKHWIEELIECFTDEEFDENGSNNYYYISAGYGHKKVYGSGLSFDIRVEVAAGYSTKFDWFIVPNIAVGIGYGW
ncbi:MAG TPA: hypothetical protein PLE68_01200 [Bacillota bacterium]|nr:hypothetical protein [Bacillota bacterium]